jgi:hypothetical protein
MFGFKQRKEEVLKSITILDSEGNEEVVYDLSLEDGPAEVEKIQLEDQRTSVVMTDMEMTDMKTMKSIRDMYPNEEDMGKFIKDACGSYKKILKDAKTLKDSKKDKDVVVTLTLEDEKLQKQALEDSEKAVKAAIEHQKSVEESTQNFYDNQRK